jgi:3-methylcrotonyl-CoA carboxylase alpha subunit
MSAGPLVTRIGAGVFRVDVDGRAEIVHVAGTRGDRWLHWNGHVFHRPFEIPEGTRRRAGADAAHALTAPMPATVLKVLVSAGGRVKKGETLLILEAMKMELPVRADADATVRALLCREGELVQAGALLAELE